MKNTSFSIVVLALLCQIPAYAEEKTSADRVRLDETVISGNQELPKVLYILPWQSSNGRPALELSAGLDDDGVFKRVEPSAYRRELQYRQALERMERTME